MLPPHKPELYVDGASLCPEIGFPSARIYALFTVLSRLVYGQRLHNDV
jgi:hypothetical protein